MNKWLDKLSSWQFALLYASCLFVAFAVAGCINWLAAGHLSLSFLVGYGVVFIIATTSAATWSRRRRHERAGRSQLGS